MVKKAQEGRVRCEKVSDRVEAKQNDKGSEVQVKLVRKCRWRSEKQQGKSRLEWSRVNQRDKEEEAKWGCGIDGSTSLNGKLCRLLFVSVHKRSHSFSNHGLSPKWGTRAAPKKWLNRQENYPQEHELITKDKAAPFTGNQSLPVEAHFYLHRSALL